MAKPKSRKNVSLDLPLSQAIQTPAHISAVIEVLAGNPLKNNDVKVVVPSQIRDSPMRTSMTAPFDSAPKHDLGTLRVLPLEILHMICQSLDLRSCFTLRHVNRQARCIVSGLPQYHALTNHALECLKIVFRSRAARLVTVDDLYKIFCSHECMVCSSSGSNQMSPQNDDLSISNAPSSGVTSIRGDDGKTPSCGVPSKSGKTKEASKKAIPDTASSGGQLRLLSATGAKTDGMFLFLPTMTRCCRSCLEESPRTRAVPLFALEHASGLDAKHFASVRVAAPLLRPKNTKKMSKKQREVMTGTVSQRDAVQVLLDNGQPLSKVKEILYGSGYIHEFSWHQMLYEREAFATIMPFFDRRAQNANRGFVCRGCEEASQTRYGHLKVRLHYFKPVYGSEAFFLEHVSKCPEANKLWEAATITALSST